MSSLPAPTGLVAAPQPLGEDTLRWAAPLQEAAGGEFRSLYIYGSALTPRFDAQSSDVNVLLVVETLDGTALEALARVFGAHAKERGTARWRWRPLVLTTAQTRGSADVFPIEFLDLCELRALLAGVDVLAGVTVGRAHLRHRCEYELRAKLVGLRQGFLLAGGAPGVAAALLQQAAGGSAAVLRHLLTLRREPHPDDPRALVGIVARTFGVSAEGLEAPFAARRQPPRNESEAVALLTTYIQALECLIAAVDAHADA
jgi:hypothetical protein